MLAFRRFAGMLRWALLGSAGLLAGCAVYDTNRYVAGQTTAAEVEKQLGVPAEKVSLANGDTEWFYPLPAARQTIAITIGQDGRFRSSEQRLDRDYIDRIRRDTWTTKEVRALLGPPYRVVRFERQQRDVWTYEWTDYNDKRLLHVQFSYDGVVREVLDMMDQRFLPFGPGVWFGGRGSFAHVRAH